MKTLFSLVFAALLAASPVFSAEKFEGKMKMKMTFDKNVMDVDYSIKGNKLRSEFPMGKGTMTSILDGDKKEMYVLMPEQKMYMVQPIDDLAGIDKTDTTGTSLEKTSETETILGYKTTKYLAHTKENKEPIEIWAAEGFGSFFNPATASKGAKRKIPAWEAELREKGFFALRIVSKGKKKENYRMEVTAVEKGPVDDSQFLPPPGYQKFSVPGLGGLLKGLGGGN